ncbi:MAG: choice-of-anchor tandem repeat GloVer-containing protein [Bryobacteraceae bacterium]|jgi:uncharacterized repeat protein (TIGR03803 family)
MRRQLHSISSTLACTALALAVAPARPAQAQTYRVLYTFTGGADGATPQAPLLLHKGILYGNTIYGGSSGNGVVFQFDLKTGRQSVVHTFAGSPGDASYPDAGMLGDAAGNLYGVSSFGGSDGYGTVFELSASGSEKIRSFTGGNGQDPQSPPVQDAAGNIYGTTYAQGPRNGGTLFNIGTSGTLTTLFAFDIRDGGGPCGGLVLLNGDLYGATYYGGADGAGVIYKVSLATGQETVLYSFTGAADGGYPLGGLAADAAGNLYGTTSVGGISENPVCPYDGPVSGCGTIFKLDTSGQLTTLYSFNGGDGDDPWGTLALDPQGNLYGTTNGGGTVVSGFCNYGCGTVFKLDTAGHFTTLHSFQGGTDGGGTLAGVTLGPGRVVYGVSGYSVPGSGLVFEIEP